MKIQTLLLLIICLSITNCSKDDTPPLSSENKILSFNLEVEGKVFSGEINHSSNSILITTNGVDLDKVITPVIKISENATIYPNPSIPQVFNKNIKYTVTAENGEIAVYTVKLLRSDNKILSFNIILNDNLLNGVIDHNAKTITFETNGIEQTTSIVPEIETSTNASLNPATTVAQNFNEEVTYTVTAENGDISVYSVIINNIPFSAEKKILSFNFEIEGEIYEGIIDNEALTVYIVTNKNIENIKPLISISDGAIITPSIEEYQNFYNPVEYIVTAQDNISNTYTVITKTFEFSTNGSKLFYSNAIVNTNGYDLDLDIPNSSIVLKNSKNSYTLNILSFNKQNYTNGRLFTSFTFNFPENIVTANDYTLTYVINNEVMVESSFYIDVLAENIPIVTSINQDSYYRNDILKVTGENLPDTISIPSNGSIFIIYKSNNYDLYVNPERTELTLTLDYSYLFPSYFGRDPQVKKINLIGSGGRKGPFFDALFN